VPSLRLRLFFPIPLLPLLVRAPLSRCCPPTSRLPLIEDCEFDSQLLLREFCKAGFNPVYCRVDDKASLDEVLQEKWDLVITDYQLPGFDGLSAVMILQKVNPNLPVILCTGYSEDVDEARVREIGIQGYMSKPVPSRALLGRIAELLEAAGLTPTYSSQSTHKPNDYELIRSFLIRLCKR